MENIEVVLAALANRAFLYKYAWRLFAAQPDGAMLALVEGPDAIDQAVLFAGDDSDLAGIQNRLRSWAREDADLTSLKAEYTRLFEGPGKLPAPPWESVYRSEGDLLFQESTLDVRRSYREAGFKASGYPSEADDHVATELSFMAALIQDAVEAMEASDVERARAFLIAQSTFLTDHLTQWLTPFADRLNERAFKGATPFYPLAAFFAAELARADKPVVEELLGVLP